MFGLVKQFCHCLAVLLDLIFQYVQVFDIAALYTTLKVGKPRLPHMLEELRLQQAVRTYQPGLAVLFQHRLSLFVGHGDDPASVPIREDFPVGGTTNPYGTTKVFTERILTDCCKADPELNVALLRYFNPIGAHPSGLIGEDPNGIPNNLVPYIAKVAVGKLEKVHVFGNDYPTPDGTGVRDYIHVVDLARGHVAAIKKLEEKPGLFICNLGTGHGYSVLDVIHAFSKACGKELPYVIDPRRPGDIAECWCDPSKAKRELGWEAQYGIEEMCAHSWNWQSHNPDGYKTAK